jgi:hypothetical protein
VGVTAAVRAGILGMMLLSTLSIYLTAAWSQSDVFHQFANKDGQAIEAKIVRVTPDWKMMTIQRRDGRSFEMQVNVLTLDDQQVVKEWIAANPSATAVQFELDVSFEKKDDTTERKKNDYYRYTTKDVTYTITVRNKSRSDLVGAKVEYAVIVEDGVRIYRDEITGEPDYYGGDDNPEEILVRGSSEVTTTLSYNHVHEFVTKPAKEETVQGDGNTTYGEDKIIGALARVLDRDGAVIGEYRSGETGVRSRTWDKTVGDGTASSDDSPRGFPRNNIPSPSPPPTPGPSMSGDLDVRELDEMPATLKKGDSVIGRASPEIGGKSIYITAKIDIDESNPNGVILAHGGVQKGYTVFIHDGKLHFWVKKALYSDRSIVRSVEISLAGLPTTPFVLGAEYTPQRLALRVNDQLRKTAESFDHFENRPQEGLTIGFDGGTSPVGPVDANRPFPGEIDDVRIRLTD